MGWLFTHGQTRAQLIKRLTEDQPIFASSEKAEPFGVRKTLKRFCSGNTLWVVHVDYDSRGVETERFIVCYLLAKHGKTDDFGPGWGYKGTAEVSGPWHVSCPDSFFAFVECPGGYATQWREDVRDYWTKKRRELEAGKTYQYAKTHAVRIHRTRPLTGFIDGTLYRLRKTDVGEELLRMIDTGQPG